MALQSVVIDVALVLRKCIASRPREMALLGEAMLSGLEGWGPGMQARLLEFFEQLVTTSLEYVERAKRQRLRPGGEPRAPDVVPPVAIQVEEPTESLSDTAMLGREPRSPGSIPVRPLNVADRGAPSSYAGEQGMSVYHLTSLVAPLLATVLAHMSPATSSMILIFRLHRLIEALVRLKHDLYLDVLEVVAYGSEVARRSALSVIATFWPRAMGHMSVAAPLPRTSYSDDIWRAQTAQEVVPAPASGHVHQYVPWSFPDDLESSTTEAEREDTNHAKASRARHSCAECRLPVNGFGLLCASGTHDPLHVRCLNAPDSSFLTHYTTATGTKLAIARFSLVALSRRATVFSPLKTDDSERAAWSIALLIGQHPFRLVNLFTLSLCFLCRRPLWGIIEQAMKCSRCRRFAHRGCLVDVSGRAARAVPPCTPLDEMPVSEVIMDWLALRKDWVSYYRQMVKSEAEVVASTYEEIAILHSVLWAQLCILEAGIAAGTIVVQETPDTISEFELHFVVQLYGAYLASNRLSRSPALDEYLAVVGPEGTDLPMFSWPMVIFITALMRSPVEHAVALPSQQQGLLAVQSAAPFSAKPAPVAHCFETMTVSLMRDVLARDFGLENPLAATQLLGFMHHHRTFFERWDGKPSLADDAICIFTLPFLIDPSISVETMVVAIESTLSDPDLSVQECGLLLLCRRCWPTAFSSPYALGRLMRAIVQWVVFEEELFASTLTHARVRSQSDLGRTAGISGAAYQANRARMLELHASKWLEALHLVDSQAYCDMLFHSLALSAAEADIMLPFLDVDTPAHDVLFLPFGFWWSYSLS